MPKSLFPTIPDYPGNRKRVLREFAWVPITFLIAFGVSAYFDISERIAAWTQQTADHYNFDEMPHSLLISAITLCWFAWRRWQEANQEITRRLEIEKKLISERIQFQTLFNENLAGNAVVSKQGLILMCNPSFAQFLEISSPEQALGSNLTDYFKKETSWENIVSRIQLAKKADIGELSIIGIYGKRTKAIARAVGHFDEADMLTSLHLFAADVTELKMAESEISELLKENNYLLRHALDLQEEERRNIARDLHDDLGQYLNAIKADTTNIIKTDGLPDDASLLAKRIISHSDHIYRSARQIMHRLRPVALDELGLSAAINHLVSTWRSPDEASTYALNMTGPLDSLDEHIAINTYRIIQEGLTNASRHANASMITVNLNLVDATLAIQIEDDGKGMDLGKPNKGLGLVGMRERIKSIGGKFDISSESGKGVNINAHIPIKQFEESFNAG
ncbi:MAG: ATP-binding protein [Methylophilaceae bacterium]